MILDAAYHLIVGMLGFVLLAYLCTWAPKIEDFSGPMEYG